MANTSPALALLAAGVPLSLLMDLADPAGPDSRGILADESPSARAFVVAEAAGLVREPVAVAG